MRRLLVAMSLFSLVAAEDAIVLHDGSRIHGTILSEDPQQLVVDCDGRRVTIGRTQVNAVLRDTGRPGAAPPDPGPARPTPQPYDPAWFDKQYDPGCRWTMWLGLAAGSGSGELQGTGSVDDTVAATSAAFASEYSLDGYAAQPGLLLRLTWERYPLGWSPLLGLQVDVGTTVGDNADLLTGSASLLAGLVAPCGPLRLQAMLRGGYALAHVDRRITLVDGLGMTLDVARDTSVVGGATWGGELLAVVPMGEAQFGFGLGYEQRTLDGDADWVSETGQYVGREDLELDRSAWYGVIAVGYGW